MQSLRLIICLFLLLGAGPAQTAVEVSSAIATEHLLQKVEPQYPALARAARVQGTVVLTVTITPEGAVANIAAVSGHPILIVAAMDAVKQWKYKPFITDGQAAAVKTKIEIPFFLGIPQAEYEKEQQAAAAYFKQRDKCEGLLRAKQYDDAESSCRVAVELVEKLPPERQNERRLAYEILGNALFDQRKFGDALAWYQKELAIAQASLRPYDAELGYALHDVALGLHGTGDLQQARSYYERAETTLEQAREHIESPFLKNEYSRSIKSVWLDYAILLRQLGDLSGAETAEQRAKAIVVRTDQAR